MARKTKKNIIVSRLKGYTSFADIFSLSSGMKTGWKAIKGTWNSTGTSVTSTDAENTYPLSTIVMSSNNYTASASVTGGTGLSFWVTDADNWYATTSYITSSTSNVCDQNFVENTSNPPSGSCCSSTNSRVVTSYPCNQNYVQNTSNPPSGSCCSGISYTAATSAYTYYYTYSASWQSAYSYSYTYGASYQSPYSYTYGATWNAGYSYTASSSYTPQSYCCGTTQLTKTYTERVNGISKCGQCSGPCTDSYSFSQCCPSGTTISGSSCYYPGSTTYSCPSGGSVSGTTCVVSGYYSCPSGGSNGGTSTCTVSVSGGYTCPSGGSNGGTSTCTVTVNVSSGYYCPSGGSQSGGVCTVQVNVSAQPAQYGCYTGTSTVNNTYYSCYTSTRSVTNYSYYLKLIQSSGGAVSSVGTDLALSSESAAIQIQISGNQVVSTAYSNASMTTSLGSRTDNLTSAITTKNVGIIKSPTPSNQGLTVSNFSATIS